MPDQNNPHILGTERIGKLLLQYSIPAIIGMTLTSLYNIIDSVFIGHGVGALAISGLAISFPLMNLIMAFCTLVGVGGATISSIRLGQKDKHGASEVLGNVLMLCIINALLFGAVSFYYLDDILRFFGASQDTLPYARDFMQIILVGTPISYTMIGLNNVMRATGYPRKAMLTSMVTVGCNIILAPIFIFYLQWGMRGAGIATVISQFVGMVWILHHFMDKESYIHFEKGMYTLKLRIVKSIFGIGMSPFLMNVCASAVVIIINNSLQTYGGDLAIGAYGIINRVLTLFVMIVLGLTMGMQPIIGYNFGARVFERVRKTLKYGIITGVVITSVGFIACELFPHLIVAMFTDSKELTEIAEKGLRICVMMFPFVGCQIVITNFFQSIGMAKISIFLSLSRQLLYLLPCLLLLSPAWGVTGVWSSMPVSDFLAFVTAVLMLLFHIKRMKKKFATVLPLFILILLSSCEMIEYHPYDGRIKGTIDINAHNIQLIEEKCANKDTIRFAVISDTQGWYDDTEDCVTSLNAHKDLDFVLHTGDLTNYGATKEFIWQRNILEKLHVPYTCIIGNHDCVGNGEEIYKKIFGDFNYAFLAGDTRFICLNTNALEFDYSERVPDFIFLENSIANIPAEHKRTVVAMHACPYSEQFGDNLAKAFQLYIHKFPSLQFCLYGHGHHFEENEIFKDGIIYYEAPCIQKRGYYIFTLTPTGYDYEKIYF